MMLYVLTNTCQTFSLAPSNEQKRILTPVQQSICTAYTIIPLEHTSYKYTCCACDNFKYTFLAASDYTSKGS